MPIKFGSNLDGGDVTPVRATQDATVTQIIAHGVEIQRKVFAGEMVPPDLVDAYAEATGESVAASSDTDYSAMGVEELQTLADERKLEVTGTGKDGNVLKSDLVAALEASD